MSSRALFSVCTALSIITSTGAVKFDLTGRHRSVSPSLFKRDSTPNSFGNGSSSVSDMSDISYACNITLGGNDFEVNIDTGSQDLYVIGDVPGTHQTDVFGNLSYGKGSVSGYINYATLVFDDFEVEYQSYIKVDNVIDTDDTPGTGLIGLGPSRGSHIRNLLNNSAGDPPLDRIFRQNLTTPNILTVLLSRSETNSTARNMTNTLIPLLEDQPGQLTIGEVIPEFDNITAQPKLPALVDTSTTNQHWTTVLDSNGIIGPDGQKIETTTKLKNFTDGKSDQLRVVFDTGFTRPQVPSYITDAIYGRVPGAEFDDEFQLWIVPCDYELNVTFMFSGHEYPLHPLDLTMLLGVNDTSAGGNGENVCVGWFQPLASNIASDPNFGAFDAILGMAFLRNTYLLINFGDFVDGSNSSVADPFIQLLSTANKTAAHLDFVKARLDGKDTTGSQKALLPISGMQTSDPNSATSNLAGNVENDSKDDDKPVYQKPWFIAVVSVAGAIVLAIVGWIIYTMTRRTRRSNVRSESAFVPPMGSYKPLIMKDDAMEHRMPIGQYSDHESGSGSGYRDPYSDNPHGH